MGALHKIEQRTALVGVVGLGYVGLPLARAFSAAGFKVLGFDIDPAKVTRLKAADSYIEAVPSDVLSNMLAEGLFDATTDMARAAECDAIALCVPTPLTKHHEPDTSFIEQTAAAIAPHITPDTLVVLESTTYPGTTTEVLSPILAEGSGLPLGEGGYLVAYSPERENPGDREWSTAKIPKVVGADDDASRAAAVALYAPTVSEVVAVSSSQAAEATKLLENVYRCVNIAVVNELKTCFRAMDLDIFEVIDAARTKPFGFKPFWPGPGVGGHCIPIDPVYLSWKAKAFGVRTRFIDLASEINATMPAYVVDRCSEALNDQSKAMRGSRILVIGVAYKKNVGDVRESPSLQLIEFLRDRGADVRYHDPFVPRLGRGRHYAIDMDSTALTPDTLAASDLVLIATDHDGVDYAAIVEYAPLVVDTRNATRDVRGERTHVTLA